MFATAAFVVVAALCVIVARYEWLIYFWAILHLDHMPLSRADLTLVAWSIWSNIFLAHLPVVTICIILHRLGWRKTASTLLVVATAGTVGFFATDILLQNTTGGHLADYIFYVARPDVWELAGNSQLIVKEAVRQLIKFAVPAAFAVVVALFISRRIGNRFPRAVGGSVAWIVCLSLFAAAVGVVPARHFLSTPLALERLHNAFPTKSLLFTPESVSEAASGAFGVNRDAEFHDALAGATLGMNDAVPPDLSISIPNDRRRDVVLLIVESLRADALDPSVMPYSALCASGGTTFTSHYANSSRSDFGGFALLYGRSPLVYDADVSASASPQFTATMRSNGYESWLVSSAHFNWKGMENFMSERAFDHADYHQDGEAWQRDEQTTARIQSLLAERDRKPRFIVAWLMSTHWDYSYPPGHEQFPVERNVDGSLRDAARRGQSHAQYLNAAHWVDSLLDPVFTAAERNQALVIFVGDHGESFGEDGAFTHSTRLSDAQCRAALFMRGPDISPGHIDRLTSHVDVLPTALHALTGADVKIKHSTGVDQFSTAGDRQRPGVLLVQKMLDAWELQLVRPQGRLDLMLTRRNSRTRLVGFADATGLVAGNTTFAPEAAPEWEQAVRAATDGLRP